jgi:hypothetical protein
LLYKNEFTDKLLKSDPVNLIKETIRLPSTDNWDWQTDWVLHEKHNESVSCSFARKNLYPKHFLKQNLFSKGGLAIFK